MSDIEDFEGLAKAYGAPAKQEQKAAASPARVMPIAPRAPIAEAALPPVIAPQDVAAAVPQMPTPVAPEIQNPIKNPELQQAALISSLPALLAGAAGIGAGVYYGKKAAGKSPVEPPASIADRTITPATSAVTPSSTNVSATEVPAVFRKQQALAEAMPPAPAPVSEVPTMPTPEQAAQRAVAAGEIPAKGTLPVSQQDLEILGGAAKAKAEKEITKAGIKPPEQKSFTSEAEFQAKKPGMVFIPGAGGADNWLEKQMGPETRKQIRDLFNQGEHYGSGEAAMKKVYADVDKYRSWLKENIPVQTLDRAERKALGVPPLKEYPTLGTVGKIAGIGGLIATAAQGANAAQQAKEGNAAPGREFLFNLLGLLPKGLGTAFNTATFSSGLNPNEAEELARRRQMAPTITAR